MDSERFDAMLRILASGTSRRGALGVLAGMTALGTCSSLNDACSCRNFGLGSLCVCGVLVCPNGPCDPETGCP